jgi:hypothetical protein
MSPDAASTAVPRMQSVGISNCTFVFCTQQVSFHFLFVVRFAILFLRRMCNNNKKKKKQEKGGSKIFRLRRALGCVRASTSDRRAPLRQQIASTSDHRPETLLIIYSSVRAVNVTGFLCCMRAVHVRIMKAGQYSTLSSSALKIGSQAAKVMMMGLTCAACSIRFYSG